MSIQQDEGILVYMICQKVTAVTCTQVSGSRGQRRMETWKTRHDGVNNDDDECANTGNRSRFRPTPIPRTKRQCDHADVLDGHGMPRLESCLPWTISIWKILEHVPVVCSRMVHVLRVVNRNGF